MRQKFSIFRNEDGSVLIITVLILVALTLTGISAITMSSIDIQIAANDKLYKTALHNADSGTFAVAKVISKTLRKSEDEGDGIVTLGDISETDKRYDAFTYLDSGKNDDGTSGPTFARELHRSESLYEDGEYAKYDTDSDIQFALNDNITDVDVQRVESAEDNEGGGIEAFAGYEGIGTGTAGGGVSIIFNLNSFGRIPPNTLSKINAVYRYVPNIPGGL